MYWALIVLAWLVIRPFEYGWSRTDENRGGVSSPYLRSSVASALSSSLIAMNDVVHHVIGVGEDGLGHRLRLLPADFPLEFPEFVLNDLVIVTDDQPRLRHPYGESHVGEHLCRAR